MSEFKKMRGLELPYDKQAFLFYACQTERSQNKPVRNAIKTALVKVGYYGDAVYDITVGGMSVRQAAEKHHYSETVLYEQRLLFYEVLAKNLFTD